MCINHLASTYLVTTKWLTYLPKQYLTFLRYLPMINTHLYKQIVDTQVKQGKSKWVYRVCYLGNSNVVHPHLCHNAFLMGGAHALVGGRTRFSFSCMHQGYKFQDIPQAQSMQIAFGKLLKYVHAILVANFCTFHHHYFGCWVVIMLEPWYMD